MRAAYRRCSRIAWRSASSALLAALCVACGTSAAAPSPSPLATVGRHSVAFTNVATTSNSRQDGGATLIVGTTDQKNELIRSLVPTLTPPAAGSILLAAFQGQQQTGGFSISITSIERDGAELIVHANFVEPARSAIVTEVLTSPAHVVSIAASDAAGAKTAVLVDGTGAERARVTLA